MSSVSISLTPERACAATSRYAVFPTTLASLAALGCLGLLPVLLHAATPYTIPASPPPALRGEELADVLLPVHGSPS